MAEPTRKPSKASNTRRDFLKKSSVITAGAVAGSLSIARSAHAASMDETIRIGLVGCGSRGTGAADQAMNTEGPTKLVAMGDVFGDRLTGSLRGLSSRHGEKVDVPEDRQFIGFDAYQKVLDSDIDLVILATPPGFRPLHFEAAVAADKHVFMEKPVATDAPGVRQVLAAAQQSKEKNLLVQVGLQRHHEPRYIETVKRIQDGAIGDIILARAYWNGAGVWVEPRRDEYTELEYQMRNWYYFNWLCGDHIVEQHIHNLDVINWIKNAYPVSAQGQGGRQVRTGKEFGQIFDHHMVEFEYADGTKLLSQCRHIRNCWDSISEHVHGTNGSADVSGARILDSNGGEIYSYGGGGGNGWQLEHNDLFAALRAGERPNEAEYGALSTMTAIFGRMATYSGHKLSWDEALNSEKSLADFAAITAFDDQAPVQPFADLTYPVPVPGFYEPV